MKFCGDDNFRYDTLPSGKVVFCCCDQYYFDEFFDVLYESFVETVTSFDSIHVHIINPSVATLLLIERDYYAKASFSWEDDAQKQELKAGCVDIVALNLSLSSTVKQMLVAEMFRGKRFSGRVMNGLVRLNIPWLWLIKQSNMNDLLVKTYFSCRRFMLPMYLYAAVKEAIIVDVDSLFTKDIDGSYMGVHSVQAVPRSESGWSKFYAGLVYIVMDESGVCFLNFLRGYMVSAIARDSFYWGIDQIALDESYRLGYLHEFPGEIMSFGGSKDVPFVSMKGDVKWKRDLGD
jgi:hypothetical protein